MNKNLFFLIFLLFGISLAFSAEADCQEHNVLGWAWANMERPAGHPEGAHDSTIGWISMSCQNCDHDLDGNWDGGECGSGPSIDYGVNIESDGNLTGYAYFEMGSGAVGWIHFDPPGPYPTCPVSTCPNGSPNYSARVDPSSKKVTGWARALNYDGGWDGWILLGPIVKGGHDYGVYIDTSTSPAQFKGWAWGSEVMGWISFNCVNQGACSNSDYKVMTSFTFNQRPYVQPNSAIISGQSYCDIGPAVGQINFEWRYEDADGDPQSHYHLQIATDPGFNAPEVDRVIPHSVSPDEKGTSAVLVVPDPTTYSRCTSGGDFEGRCVAYGNSYYWRVRVKAASGNQDWSDWETGSSFDTPRHAYPWVDFSWHPEEPSVGEVVQFNDLSECYDVNNNSVDCSSFSWTFQDGDPPSSSVKNATTTFASRGSKTVTLQVSDGDGSCSVSKTVNVQFPLPEYKEVPPVIWLKNFFAQLTNTFLRF